MSEDFDRLIAASSSCDLDEVDYPYVNVNPSVDQGSDDPQDLDPEFKASSLLLAMDSGDDIQATPETCLLINKTLQEVVNDLLKIIAKEMQGIEITKMHVVPPGVNPNFMGGASVFENGLDTDTTADLSAVPSNSRSDRLLQKTRVPFFQGRDLSKPMPNQEASLRRQRGEFNLPEFVPLRWRKSDNRRLIRAVAFDCRQRRLESLMRELNKKEEEYNEWLIVGPKSKALKKDKDELTYRIAQLQASSDEAFVNRAMTQEEVDQVDWMKISAVDFDGAISDRNLRLVWMNQFNKANNYGAWSKKEDEALSDAIVRFGLHAWEQVAKEVGTKRTPFMCIQRYQQRLVPRQAPPEKRVDLDSELSTERPWTTAEDARLLDLVKMATDEQGVIHWIFVNTHVSGHSLEECRSRWAEISPNIQSGPFTEREDLQLLLGVQRYGSENFDLVAAKTLSHRDARDCRKRYMQLTCDLASEWTYEEDRKLFLLMEKVEETYRNRIKAGPTQNIFIPQRCYKDLLIHLPGRTWQTIRNRHRLLKSWNLAYLNLRRMVCRTHYDEEEKDNDNISVDDLQSDSSRWTREQVRAVFLRTPFMLNLLEKLQSAGARSAEFIRDIFSTEIATKTEALESGRPLTINLELDPMLRDAAEGIIVPRPLPRDRWVHIMRHTEVRMLLETRVRNALQEQIEEELQKKGVKDLEAAMSNPDLFPSKRMQVIRTLLEDEDHFLLAMEQSLRHHSIANRFEDFKSVSGYLNLVPQIVKRCIADTHGLLSRCDDSELLRSSNPKDSHSDEEREVEVEKTSAAGDAAFSVPTEEMDGEEEEALVRIEIQKRMTITSENRPTRMNDVKLMHKLKRCFEIFSFRRRVDRVHNLKRWKKTPMDEVESDATDMQPKVFQLLSTALQKGSRSEERAQLRQVSKRGRAKMQTLPPNCTTLNAFRLLLHQRPQLLTRGHFHLEALFRSRLETVEAERQAAMRVEMQSFSQEDGRADRPVRRPKRMFELLMQNHLLNDHRQLLRDPRYLLLKARLFALFLWPSILSTGNVEDYLYTLQGSVDISRREAKRLERKQRSARKKLTPKQQFFQSMRQRIAKRHEEAGIDPRAQKKARRQAIFGSQRNQARRELGDKYQLRSTTTMRPDLVRVHVTETKSLVMPFAALELMRSGYQLDSYFPIDDGSNALIAEQNSVSLSASRVVKQELMDE